MTVSVSAKNFTSIDYCENASNFTGSTPADVTDFFKQGTQCVGFTMKSSGNNDTSLSGSWNLTNKHLHFWYMTVALKELNVEASGGFQVYLSDGTNTGYYYLTGSDTYPGGWLNLVLDCNRSPSSGSQPTLSAITTIGFRQNLTATAKNVQNTWIDNIYVADGLIAYGDVSGSPFDLDDIMTVEDSPTSGGWGIMRKIGGVYFLTGALDFGDTVSTNGLKFSESGQVLVFENRPVATTYYGVTVAGNATGVTEFTMGSKSGTQGISGCTIRVSSLSQTPKWFMDADDTNLDKFQLYGCTFVDHNLVEFPTYDSGTPANREAVSCTFESGNSEVEASTFVVKYCNFISSAGVAVEINDPTTHHVSDCNFIACNIGVDCTAQGTYTFLNMSFTGCTTDVRNSVNATTTDSYAEGNYDTDQQLYAGATTGTAQSFTGDGNKLTNVSFYLRKVNSPTGNAYAKLYATSGGVPTGSALATSKALDVSTLGTSYAVKKIDFDDSQFYTLSNGVTYAIAIEYASGDSTNRIEAGYDAGGSHGGTKSNYTGSWAADTGNDLCFYLRTGGDVTIGATNSNPTTTTETGTPAGTTNINNTATITFDKMKDNTEVRIYKAGTSEQIAGIEDATAGSQDNRNYAWTYNVGAQVDYVLHNFQPGVTVYKTIRVEGYTVPSTSQTIDIQQVVDRNVS